MFPEPELENVYAAWKPLDRGHPLVDVTIHYAPPELERVHIGKTSYKSQNFGFTVNFGLISWPSISSSLTDSAKIYVEKQVA